MTFLHLLTTKFMKVNYYLALNAIINFSLFLKVIKSYSNFLCLVFVTTIGKLLAIYFMAA